MPRTVSQSTDDSTGIVTDALTAKYKAKATQQRANRRHGNSAGTTSAVPESSKISRIAITVYDLLPLIYSSASGS